MDKILKIQRQRAIRRCQILAESSSNSHGFVTVHALAEAAGCEIVSRPLLVEAGITTSIQDPTKWFVLVNSRIHHISLESYYCESHISPLNVRTRNTIAHEIAHLVVIQTMGNAFARGKLDQRGVERIEKLVESISPLLLVPQSETVRKLRCYDGKQSTIYRINKLADTLGVSKWILLGAIKRFSKDSRSEFLTIESLIECGWGVAKWGNAKTFTTFGRSFFNNSHSTKASWASTYISANKCCTWKVVSIRGDSEQKTVKAITTLNNSASSGEVKFNFSAECFNGKGSFIYQVPSE